MAVAEGRIRIVSDGTPAGTQVLQPNGEKLPGRIIEVTWKASAGSQPATATITFSAVELVAEGEIAPAPRSAPPNA